MVEEDWAADDANGCPVRGLLVTTATIHPTPTPPPRIMDLTPFGPLPNVTLLMLYSGSDLQDPDI